MTKKKGEVGKSVPHPSQLTSGEQDIDTDNWAQGDKKLRDVLKLENLLVDLYELAFRDGSKGIKKRERVQVILHDIEAVLSARGSGERSVPTPTIRETDRNSRIDELKKLKEYMTLYPVDPKWENAVPEVQIDLAIAELEGEKHE